MIEYIESRRITIAAFVAVFSHIGMCALALT